MIFWNARAPFDLNNLCEDTHLMLAREMPYSSSSWDRLSLWFVCYNFPFSFFVLAASVAVKFEFCPCCLF